MEGYADVFAEMGKTIDALRKERKMTKPALECVVNSSSHKISLKNKSEYCQQVMS